MTRNHLPGGADLETFGRPLHAEAPFRGVGSAPFRRVSSAPMIGRMPAAVAAL